MAHAFDPGYGEEPFRGLVERYPGTDVYPQADFRTEWGPIFHRGRLDGTARLLVIGQDPGQHESFVRRILVGAAGQRSQGFLAKLGIESSYVMMNTFLYGAYGQQGAQHHANDPQIAAYRGLWLAALFSKGTIEAVVSLGSLAHEAWQKWKKTPEGAPHANVLHAHITHPTQPESSSKDDPVKLAEATSALLANWNAALPELHAKITPDVQRPLVLYGTEWAASDLVEVPERDLPAGLPSWMRGLAPWAVRAGTSAKEKRATLTVTVPADELP
jgi:uracil-DNA glycosylase